MFDVDERERLLTLAAPDPVVVGDSITGSEAVGAGDRWSDIDLAFAIDGELDTVLDRWMR